MKINSCTVIGAGGTGQQMIPSLLRLLQFHPNGTTDVVVNDGDQFEEHNAARQIGSSGSKAEAMNRLLELQGLPPVCKDRYVSRSALKRMRERDQDAGGLRLIIACVDNDATRKVCCDVLDEVPGDFIFITPGNSDAEDPEAAIKVSLLWHGRIGHQAIGINPALLYENLITPQDAIPRKGSCIEAAESAPQLISANALAAASTLCLVQNLLDDLMPSHYSNCRLNGRTFASTIS